jgi:hypothetical protein
MSIYLTNEELNKIQEMNSDYTKAKIALGDLELNKQSILKQIEIMRLEFSDNEKVLIQKYGKDSVINLQTGEVTQK